MERNRTKSGLGNLPDQRGKGARKQLAKHQRAPVSDQNPRGVANGHLATNSPLAPSANAYSCADRHTQRQRSHQLFWAMAFQYVYD